MNKEGQSFPIIGGTQQKREYPEITQEQLAESMRIAEEADLLPTIIEEDDNDAVVELIDPVLEANNEKVQERIDEAERIRKIEYLKLVKKIVNKERKEKKQQEGYRIGGSKPTLESRAKKYKVKRNNQKQARRANRGK